MAKVIYEFDLNDDYEKVEAYQKAESSYKALCDIYFFCRNEVKHGDHEEDGEVERVCERVMSITHEVGVL